MAQELSVAKERDVVEAVVSSPPDVLRAAQLATETAASFGFPAEQSEEIGLAATELASNLIRHASAGTLRFSQLQTGDRAGIEIQSADRGQGIADVDQAMADGYSTAGGLGLGLGAVNRLMDELEIYSGPTGGVNLVCRRWVRALPSPVIWGGLEFGAATRSRRRLQHNGDTFLFKQWDRYSLLGVIDGLGHGPFAQRAAQTARQYIEHHFDQPLKNLFRGAGRACQGTRGVVMALARFDRPRQSISVASVGNIETRVFGGEQRLNLIVRRGIVGLNAPEALPIEHPWTPASILIMHSDGLRTHWDWSSFRHLERETPEVIARRLLAELGKPDDDATVILARSAQ